jgi:hypothetical protein
MAGRARGQWDGRLRRASRRGGQRDLKNGRPQKCLEVRSTRLENVTAIPRDEVLDNCTQPGPGRRRRFEHFGKGDVNWPVNLGATLGGPIPPKPKLDLDGLCPQFAMSIN